MPKRRHTRSTTLSYLFPLLRYHSRWNELTAEDFKYLFRRDIGSSREEVVAAYGESSGVVSSKLTYSDGGVSLNFIIENGKVISIEYLPA